MDAPVTYDPRPRRIALPSRGGVVAALEFGPADRPVDIVFVHANGFNARTYRSILAPLGDAYRVVAIDQRGHGATTLPTEVEGRGDWHDLGDDLAAVIAALDAPPLLLAGHSMGGASCILAADIAPARVRRLTLFDPVVMPGRRAAAAPSDSPLIQGALRRRDRFASREEAFAAYKGRGAFKAWSDVQLADYLAAGLRESAEGDVQLACRPEWEASNFATSQGHDIWSVLQRAPRPIRILRAATGSTCGLDAAQVDALAARGQVSVETVPGSTHFLPMEHPDLVQQVLREAMEA